MGNNLNEYAFFLCAVYSISTFKVSDYNNYLTQQVVPSSLQAVQQLYPVSNYPNPLEAIIDVMSDYSYKCKGKQLADAVYSTVPVFYYSFEITPGFSNPCDLAAHSYDLPFYFPSTLPNYGNGNYVLNQNELNLGSFMIASWGKFMYTGNPGSQWTQYNSAAPYIRLSVTNGEGVGFKQTACNYWNLGILPTGSSLKLVVPFALIAFVLVFIL